MGTRDRGRFISYKLQGWLFILFEHFGKSLVSLWRHAVIPAKAGIQYFFFLENHVSFQLKLFNIAHCKSVILSLSKGGT